MKEYKKQHIIKHTLEMYVERAGVSEKDLNQKKTVLKEVKEDILRMKNKYGIKE